MHIWLRKVREFFVLVRKLKGKPEQEKTPLNENDQNAPDFPAHLPGFFFAKLPSVCCFAVLLRSGIFCGKSGATRFSNGASSSWHRLAPRCRQGRKAQHFSKTVFLEEEKRKAGQTQLFPQSGPSDNKVRVPVGADPCQCSGTGTWLARLQLLPPIIGQQCRIGNSVFLWSHGGNCIAGLAVMENPDPQRPATQTLQVVISPCT